MNRSIRASISALMASVFCFFAYQNTYAIPIKITDPTPTYAASVPACTGVNGENYTNCTSKAHIDAATSLNGKDASFKKSFDAWNATNAAAAKWTLVDGGALPGGQFEVSIFDALAFPMVGGLEIKVEWTYSGADKGDFKWAQGLLDNYLLSPTKIVPAFYEMDVNAAGADKPPLYPFQYADRHFYDKPLAPWPDSFFEAWAFLTKADFATRQLTIYEGINYGFKLSVPEPSSLLLALSGIVAMLAIRRRINLIRT